MSQESLRKRFISHLKDEQRSRLRYKRAKRRSDDDKINVTEPVIEVSSDGYLDLKRWVSWGKVADELGSGRSVTGEHGLVVDQHEIIRRNWASHQLFRSMKSYKDQILSSLDKLDKVWDQHHEQQQLQQQQLQLQQLDTFLTQLPLNESVDTSIQPSKLHSPKLQKQPTKNEAHIQLLRETVGAATRAVVRKWTPEEDKILKLFVETHGHKWQAASQLLPGRSKASCYCRWVYSLSPDCNKEDWTEAEIERLVYIVRRLHPSAFYLKWQPDVDLPAIVGKVPQPPADDPHLATLVDEEIAKHKQSKNGQTRGKLTSAHWGTIAKLHGNGRPLDQCKTRFSTHLYSIARQHGLVFSGPWTADEDARLVDAVKTIYKGALNATATAGSDKESLTLQQMHTWQAVAQLVGTRSMRYCRSRWMRMHAKNHNLDL
ncbi:hypothetical protein GQ42DRAFT_153711 [Ramicandelaber brevisporus]|nr:hypothetical protein GQ42DRAFT_153711 [Ramicandelaber brevisporus]